MDVAEGGTRLASFVVGSAVVAHVIFNRMQFKNLPLPLFLLSVFASAPILLQTYYVGKLAFHPGTILRTYSGFFFCLGLSVTLYRLSPLHPLYSFPGPLLARITKLWGVWASWTGRQHRIVENLHKKYGPFVRTGPNELSIADADAVITVLGASGLQKGLFYETRSDPAAPKNLIVLKGDEHANRRRLWNRGMSTDSIVEYEGLISRRAEQLVDAISKLRGPVDMASWLSYFSFDFMGDMAFGGGFEMLQAGGDKDGLWKVLDDYMITQSLISHVPWASRVLYRLPYVSERVSTLRRFGASCATARVKSGSVKRDLWYHLTDEAGIEKEKPSVRNVVSDGALAIIAGADTTARAMTSLLFFLCANREYYSRLRDEIDAVFVEGENALDTSKYNQLPFLDACISETLRLHPPVPTNGPRRVEEGSGGHAVAGRFIPESTEIYVPPYTLHHDPRNFFPSPDKFWPDRWLLKPDATDAAADVKGFVHNSTAFIPFSYGPANCVGRTLARLEIKMIVNLLFTRFDLRFADGFDETKWEDSLCDYFVMSAKEPLNILLSPR